MTVPSTSGRSSDGVSVFGVWHSGWRRVADAPMLVAGVFLLTFLLAWPLALSVRGAIELHLGSSAVADRVATNVDYDWWQEFLEQARGLGTTFTPTIIGFAATLDNTNSILDGQREIMPVMAAIAAYLATWIFLMGGIVDRYGRQRRTRAYGFFAACGGYFPRLLRLAAVAALVYWWLFAYVHPWLFDEWYSDLTRDVNVERVAFAWRLGLYVLFAVPLLLVNVVFDYARVRLILEDRRSVLGAVAAALRFITRNARAVATLSAVNALVFLLIVAAWAAVAPRTDWPVLAAFGIGQLYLLARMVLKLQFVASEVALFQARLAHARFTRAPEPVWPESPLAETIRA